MLDVSGISSDLVPLIGKIDVSEVAEKRCRKCGEVKETSDFYRNASKKSGRADRCKQCADQHSRNWRVANPEKAREFAAKANLKARTTERSRLSYLVRDAISDDVERGRLPPMALKERAAIRDEVVEFALSHNRSSITGQHFEADLVIGKGPCAQPYVRSVDRIDNTKGHTLDNVRIVTAIENMAMSAWPVDAFDLMCIERTAYLIADDNRQDALNVLVECLQDSGFDEVSIKRNVHTVH